MKILNIFYLINQRLYETPERSLEQAYRSALRIKDIQDKYFNGKIVSYENTEYSARVVTYLQVELKKYLQTIKIRIAEFNLSQKIINIVNPSTRRYQQGGEIIVFSDIQSSVVIEKLELIEAITTPYKFLQSRQPFNSYRSNTIKNTQEQEGSMDKPKTPRNNQKVQKSIGQPDQKGVIPRSFFTSLNRLKQEVEPESSQTEEDIIKQFRESRYQTNVSIRFILILIIVPIFVYQISKTFIVTPILTKYYFDKDRIVFLNDDLQNEAIRELKDFKEMLEFRSLIGIIEPIEPEEKEKQIKEKAQELSLEYGQKSINAIGNIFEDALAFLSIVLVLVTNRRELDVVKDFFNRLFYNLSDSAKAFILILFTDMFVGFHSPHGWEVIIDSILRHFGLPENHDFSFLFIATFPVILDTVFKYWIFRYLNGLSPSSVATFKNMNE